MGLLDFASEIGKKLFGSEEEGGEKIKQHIEDDNPGIEDLQVEVKDGVAEIKGKAKDQSALQKAILMAGNVFGIKEVKADEVEAPPATVEEAKVEYYEIQKGDTLWAIAKVHLGNGAKYTEIFEANREVIKDPDLIYPGQKIRIPR
ncbi:peptidoglycan-binding protein LysM [Pseudomonadota bacterium]